MAVVNRRKFGNEASTKEGACSVSGTSISQSRIALKTVGSILLLSFITAGQSAYAGEHADVSPSAAPAQTSPAMSTTKAIANAHPTAINSPMSGASKEPEIVWEPIGKYSQKEIDLVSDTVGELFSHMKKMEALDSTVAPFFRGKKAPDKAAMLRTAKSYSADATEESKKIDQFKIPALKNQQAAEMLVKAKTGLKDASEIQKVRASKLIKMASGTGDSKALSDEIQQLGSQRISAAFQFVNAYGAYNSYGYTSDQIDLTTGRLKPDAKPDRLAPDPQTAKKNTP